jgi:hypothetical protein
MILKNHVTIDKFMLDDTKHSSELIHYITTNMKRDLVDEMLNKIEPGKDYLIRLRGADYYEETSTNMCGYKMALKVDGWTPCSERLPDIGQFVLLSGKIEGATKIIIAMGDQVGYWQSKLPGLAWMPLPEPWKGADDESVDSN